MYARHLQNCGGRRFGFRNGHVYVNPFRKSIRYRQRGCGLNLNTCPVSGPISAVRPRRSAAYRVYLRLVSRAIPYGQHHRQPRCQCARHHHLLPYRNGCRQLQQNRFGNGNRIAGPRWTWATTPRYAPPPTWYWMRAGNSFYFWSNGAVVPTIPVSDAGTYFVTVIDNFGCQGRDTVTVNNFPDLQPCPAAHGFAVRYTRRGIGCRTGYTSSIPGNGTLGGQTFPVTASGNYAFNRNGCQQLFVQP